MDYKQIILENLTRRQATLAVKVLVSKIQSKFSVAINNKKPTLQSYSIMNDVDQDWSAIIFKFAIEDGTINYSIVVDDSMHKALLSVRINTAESNKHHQKLIDQAYTDLVNRLYKMLTSDGTVKFNQLKSAFEHIKQVEKYISHDNELVQKANS